MVNDSLLSKDKQLAGNTATSTLKLIALFFMFMDHAGKMLFPNTIEMRVFGRIAFPVYCWCLVAGSVYTSCMPKYLLRLLVAGIVSQPLYVVALNHTWKEPNIFLTLFIALLGLWGIREKKWGSQIWAPPLTLIMATLLNANYGWKGVLFVYLLYGARKSKSAIASVFLAFCLYWGTTSSVIGTLFGISFKNILSDGTIGGILSPLFRLQALSILALPCILIPMKNVKLPKWLSYVIYPLHLLILWGLEQIM